MSKPITISDLIDYLQQYDGDDVVVLRADDVEDDEISLETALDAIADNRDDEIDDQDDQDDDR